MILLLNNLLLWNNRRYYNDGTIGISLDETTTVKDVNDLYKIFSANITIEDVAQDDSYLARSLDRSNFYRTIPYLQHPVFNSYHSETRIVRYMKSLENKDVSLVHSMIPLVSDCYFTNSSFHSLFVSNISTFI